MSIYGAPQEAEDIATLEKLGFEVLNPNLPEHQLACKNHDNPMDYFKALAGGCDCLAFRAFPDGGIGAGIVGEMESMGGKPCFELPTLVAERSMDVEETRATLRELGQR
jgi:hypothetical protein